MVVSTDFTKMVPGFDFLQGLMKNAGAGLPSMGQWIAPTLDPEELDKRIGELRTVQFWLEQNAKLLATTIQALEVQRMTLSTLKTMNMPLAELRGALTLPEAKAAAAGAPPPAAPPEKAAAPRRRASAAPPARARSGTAATAAPRTAAAVDPMQWWGALTQQFTELATKAVRDSSAEAARQIAGAVVKQGLDSAGQTLKKAASAPAKVAARVAQAAAAQAANAVNAAPAAGAARPAGTGAASRSARGGSRTARPRKG
jgi:hypothetical protein